MKRRLKYGLCILFISLLVFQVQAADFDGNGTVDFADFLSFVSVFGTTDSHHDLNGNGTVDFPDFLMFAAQFSQAANSKVTLILEEGFESGKHTFIISGNSPEVIEEPDALNGNYMMKSQLTPSSKDPKRTEVSLNTTSLMYEVDREYWTGISIKIDNDFNDFSRFDDQGMLMQWHYKNWLHPEAPDKQPLLLRFTGDEVRVHNEVLGKYMATVPPAYGEWVDWVFHVKFSDVDGIIQVWRNGELIVDWTGDNHQTEMIEGAYLKFGLYSYQYQNSPMPSSATRTVFHDELRIAGADGNYESVAPQRNTKD
jgi:hypothetical protein